MLSMKQKVVLLVLVSALTAVLAAGLIRTTVTYDVELVTSPSGPVVYAPFGQPFNISCQVLGGDSNNVSAMKWLGPKGNDISGEGNPGIVKSGNNLLYLTFTDPKSVDRGIYKCVAKYAKDYNLQYEVIIHIFGLAPEFDAGFENETYNEGDRVELHCFARGETPITYTWYNNTGERKKGFYNQTQLGDVMEGEGSWNESYLVIPSVQVSDEGVYSCSANNSQGLSIKHIFVDVIPESGLKPRVDSSFEIVTTHEGASLTFNCTAEGEQPIRYIWYNQSTDIPRVLPGDSSLRVFATRQWLVFRHVRLHDAGSYSCDAINSHGKDFKFYDLKVRDNSLDLKVVNVTATSLQFQIVTSEIGDFVQVLYKERQEGQSHRMLFGMGLDEIYTIKNLVPGGLYTIQYRLGTWRGNFTELSRGFSVTLLPDPPELIIRRQEKGILELEWFQNDEDIKRGSINKHQISYYSIIEAGNRWLRRDCSVTIEIPRCHGSSYIVSGLQPQTYYEIEVRAHTDAGYGEPATQKNLYVCMMNVLKDIHERRN